MPFLELTLPCTEAEESRYQTALEMRDALLAAANAAGVDAIAHFSSPFPRASAPPSVPTGCLSA